MRRIFLTSLLGAALAPFPASGQYGPPPPRLERVAEPLPPRAEPVDEPEPEAEESSAPRALPVDEPEPPETAPGLNPAPPKALIVPDDEDGEPGNESRKGKPKPRDKDEAEPIDVRAVSSDEAPAIDVKPAAPGAPVQDSAVKRPEKPKIAVNLNTDTNARPLSLRVPAPRGQIVDRRGEPLAQNRIGYYLGVQLPMEDKMPDAAVINNARVAVDWVKGTLPGGWNMPDAKIIEHYHERRWVPLLSDTLVPDDLVARMRDHLPTNVVLRPFYLRSYPEETMASHVLGYMQKNGKMGAGDLVSEELLWTPTIGSAGLEKEFDAELTGKPGLYSVLYNSGGEKITEEWVERPTAGNTVVTSIDARFQRIVEREMQADKVKGAFVIMDVKTGDVVTICSNPGFNPNDRVYGISDEKLAALNNDPDIPLLPRALQGLYPPASTFKVVTALAALESGKVTEDTYFSCPNGMRFSNIWMRNHNKNSEGDMDVVRAIKRSCNTWFFQAAMATGGNNLAAMGTRLGFGEKTGICLPSMEVKGRMPTPEYYQALRRGRMTGGVLANVSIGQGDVEATPLQVAQMMAAVARGDAIPRPRLVRQIQDVKGNIIQNFPPSVRSTLTLKKESLDAVRRGMRAVVADPDGTGKEASNNYVAISGKTGTGEWKESPKKNVAWFAGFIPSKNPEYAFAALYEGAAGETVSGGRTVAPLVGNVFNKIYKLKKEGNEMPDEKAKDKEGDDEDKENDNAVASSGKKRKSAPQTASRQPEQVSAPAPPPVLAQPPRVGGIRGFFQRFRRQ
ncbi:MAG: penicillin-binding transpeptidase domain-containing protein [Verrucomicrobiota bacterium]